MSTKYKKRTKKEINEILYNVIDHVHGGFKKSDITKFTKKDVEDYLLLVGERMLEYSSKLDSFYADKENLAIDYKQNRITFASHSRPRSSATPTNQVQPFERLSQAHKEMRKRVHTLVEEKGADVKEHIDALCEASDTIDVIAFHVALMNGTDPRIVSVISQLVDLIHYEVTERGDLAPNIEEWAQIRDCVAMYYYNEKVDIGTSLKAANELLSVTTPKLKQTEFKEPTKQSRLDKIGVSMDDLKKLKPREAKQLITLLNKLKDGDE